MGSSGINAVQYIWQNDPLISTTFKQMEAGDNATNGLLLDMTTEFFGMRLIE